MKRILVTGASGFVGRHSLAPLAERGFEVHAAATTPRPDVSAEAIWHAVDLHDGAAAGALLDRVRPSHLLHLAWCATPGSYWTSPENFRWVRSSLAMLDRFVALGGVRFVGVGTCAEYDWSYGYCREGVTPCEPSTPYGVSKDAFRRMAECSGRAFGLEVAWARLFFLFGPYEPPSRLVPSIARALLAGEPALCSHGRQTRDFLYVEDVGAALAALADARATGAVNVASGRGVSIGEIASRVGELAGRADMVRLGALAPRDGEPEFLVGSTTRLSDEIGWTPRYGLSEGLEKTLRWWQRQ